MATVRRRDLDPRLTLRGLDDELALEVLDVAARGVHDPATMPFLVPWTDHEPPDLQIPDPR